MESGEPGEMIANLRYEDGKIVFSASAHKGNAVIAARDEAGTILWSWHIWMTDKPAEQVYNNGAGTMMDRNLGATSATPDDPGSFGLMYQWGKKDPFCGVAELASGKSTKLSTKAQWPEAVVSDANTGTIEYTLSHAHSLGESLPSESPLPATDLKGHCHFISIVLVCEKFGGGNFSAFNTKYAKMRQRGEGDTLTFDVDRFGEKNKILFYWSIAGKSHAYLLSC